MNNNHNPTGKIILTEGDLRRMFPHARDDYIKAFMDGKDLFEAAGFFDNSNRWCAFIGNVGEETGGLTIVRENMRYTARNLLAVWPSRYPNTIAGRAKARRHAKRGERFIANYNYGFRLGNRGRKTDDGYNFRGALGTQHTGRNMAQWLQRVTNIPFVDDPTNFDKVENTVLPAVKVWTEQDGIGNLHKWADRGQFRATCNGINRGNPRSKYNPIGWAGRKRYYRKARTIWGHSAEEKKFEGMLREGDTGYRVLKLQERLLELGYNSLGRADRDFGDNTATALMNFQRVNNLDVDAIYGPKTQAVLESDEALPKPQNAERIEATVEDVKATGSKTIQATQSGKAVVKAVTATGVLGMAESIGTQIQSVRNVIEPLQSQVSWMAAYWPIGVLVAAWLAWNYFDTAEKSRVNDHATGKNMGR